MKNEGSMSGHSARVAHRRLCGAQGTVRCKLCLVLPPFWNAACFDPLAYGLRLAAERASNR